MRCLTAALLLFTSVFFSCNPENKPSTQATNISAPPPPKLAPQSALSNAATEDLMDMLNSYYSLKDALVADNGGKADEAAARLMSSSELFLSKYSTDSISNNIKKDVQLIMKKSEAITRFYPENIDARRIIFAEISDAVYVLDTSARLQHAGVYRAFCPMAFDSKGAYWLSAESEIKNPYFGKKMLECGEVRDSL